MWKPPAHFKCRSFAPKNIFVPACYGWRTCFCSHFEELYTSSSTIAIGWLDKAVKLPNRANQPKNHQKSHRCLSSRILVSFYSDIVEYSWSCSTIFNMTKLFAWPFGLALGYTPSPMSAQSYYKYSSPALDWACRICFSESSNGSGSESRVEAGTNTPCKASVLQ